MKLTLCDRNQDLCERWIDAFEDISDVDVLVVCGDIFNDKNARYDAIVSPANSYGYMTGGVDLSISRHFGWDLQKRLQAEIAELPMQMLLVGQTLAIQTNNDYIPWLLSSPTMEVALNVSDTRNAYLAMKSTLLEARARGFDSIICPGLATCTGELDSALCAQQMRRAYDEIILGKFPIFQSFYEAQYYYYGMTNIYAKSRQRSPK